MIEAIFSEDKKYVQTEGIWQYDRGVKIRVSGLSGLNADTEFHFETKKNGPAIVKKGTYSSQDNSITVDIPAAFIESTENFPKNVWVYLKQGDNQFTDAVIRIPVYSRECPDDYITQEDLSKDTVIERSVEAYFSKTHILDGFENSSRKKTSISNHSQEGDSDTNYPTVGAVRDYVNAGIENFEDYVDAGIEFLTDYVDSEIGSIDDAKAEKSATLAGYGITNAYTKSEVDALLENHESAVQLVPEFANSISDCVDTTKLYVLPDGFIYAYMYGESDPVNLLTEDNIYLNKRKNSSGVLSDANGYITTDYISVSEDDVIRFTNAAILSNNYCRIKFFDSSGNRVIVGGDDWKTSAEFKIMTDNDGYPYIVVGYANTTSEDNSTNRKAPNAANIAKCYMNLYIQSSAITGTAADIVEAVKVTKNEPMSGSAGYAWRNTGHAFVPADYEDEIDALSGAVESAQDDILTLNDRVGSLELSSGGNLLCGKIYAPSPQPAADGTVGSDFNADSVTSNDIHSAIAALCLDYPDYITAETLGKDASNTFDWTRYVLCKHYYSAWQKQDHPKMYAWKNGGAVIYSTSVSPRIGDTMYSTEFVGTSVGTVSAVDNANPSRTVDGTVYSRDKSSDIEPTLVYTSILDDGVNGKVYSISKSVVTRISSLSGDRFTGTDGNLYLRYPMGDRNSKMQRKKVIVIGANEHGFPGDPREPAIVTTRLITDLCRRDKANNAFIDLLKNDYMIIACPVINPWGFNQTLSGYVNSNGVNINRNYDTPGFGLNTDGEPSGSYGGSEIETQYFMNTISESGAAVAVSYHALGYSGSAEANAGYVCHYQYNGINNDLRKIEAIAELMKSNYNLKFTSYGEADPQTTAKSPSYITYAGAAGGIIEMQPVERDAQGIASYHTAKNMEANYTLMLNTLYLFLSDN